MTSIYQVIQHINQVAHQRAYLQSDTFKKELLELDRLQAKCDAAKAAYLALRAKNDLERAKLST